MTTSPRFPERKSKIDNIIEPTNLKQVWNKHVRQANRQQLIGDLADYLDVHLNLDHHINIAISKLLAGTYVPVPPLRVLAEKSRGLCRQIIVPGPIDALVLQVLVNAIQPPLLANQPTKNTFYQAQAHTLNTSHVERMDEQIYGSRQSWLAFQAEIFHFTKFYPYLVVADIANYYDYIEIDQIKAIFQSFDGLDEVLLDLIFYILDRYNWRPDYIPGTNRGLPQMNFDAPRLLAHSFLFELDRFIAKNALGAYARFMDDIDVGVRSIGDAKRLIRDIDLVLHSRGVRLNSGKTQIMTAGEASNHYFVSENRALSFFDYRLARRLEQARKAKTPFDPKPWDRMVRARLRKNLAIQGFYDRGNGDKVLKRHIGFLIRYGIDVPDKVLFSFMLNRPSIREIGIKALAFKGYSRARFDALRNYVTGGYCVDDASVFFVAKAIVDLSCPNGRKFRADLDALVEHLLELNREVAFLCALWLVSKFRSTRSILECVRSNQSIWFDNEWLGRQVGAICGRFIGEEVFTEYLEIIRQSRNAGAQATFSLHHLLAREGANAQPIFAYLKALNPSQPRRFIFPKILLLRSFLMSPALQASKQSLRAIYRALPLDFYELRCLRGVL